MLPSMSLSSAIFSALPTQLSISCSQIDKVVSLVSSPAMIDRPGKGFDI